jgi:hypothetical protein
VPFSPQYWTLRKVQSVTGKAARIAGSEFKYVSAANLGAFLFVNANLLQTKLL